MSGLTMTRNEIEAIKGTIALPFNRHSDHLGDYVRMHPDVANRLCDLAILGLAEGKVMVPREPVAYAVQNDQGYWVGIWNWYSDAELVISKGNRSHNEKIIPVYLTPRSDDTKRLAWLHSGFEMDEEGFQWGVYRVKWDDAGKPLSVLQTLSDYSDLDKAMLAASEAKP